jgi:hypothetical protein
MPAKSYRGQGRTNPKLWEACKKAAIKKLGGRHSARAMQLAGKMYRERGGKYTGKKTEAQRRLTKWTREDWRTYTGNKARRIVDGKVVYDRYLPAAAWKKLTPAQVRATRQKKLKARHQYVPNTQAAMKAGAKARKSSRKNK